MGFNKGQVTISVGAAVFKAMQFRELKVNTKAIVAIAFPDEPYVRSTVESIASSLQKANIGVLWVTNDLSVDSWGCEPFA